MGFGVGRELIPAMMLLIGMMLIVTASFLFWFQICVNGTCFKRPRKASLILGVLGWALYLLVMVPTL